MRSALPLLLILGLPSCATEPGDTPGFATVTGTVFLASTQPLASPAVAVSCGGRALALAQGDSTGRYHVGLQASAGRHRCTFLATAPGVTSIQLDTAIGFSPAGLHPLQFIDIHPPATP